MPTIYPHYEPSQSLNSSKFTDYLQFLLISVLKMSNKKSFWDIKRIMYHMGFDLDKKILLKRLQRKND